MTSVRARLFTSHIAAQRASAWQRLDIVEAMRLAELDEPHAHAIAREAGIRVGRLLDAVEAIPVDEWGRRRWRRIAAWLADERRDPVRGREARVIEVSSYPLRRSPTGEIDMAARFEALNEPWNFTGVPLTAPRDQGGEVARLDGAAVAELPTEMASFFEVTSGEDGLTGTITMTSFPPDSTAFQMLLRGDADLDNDEVRELIGVLDIEVVVPEKEANFFEVTASKAA